MSIVRMTFVCLVSVCKRLCNVRTRSIMCLHLMFMLRSCSVRFPFANGGMQTLHKRLKNVCVLGGRLPMEHIGLTSGLITVGGAASCPCDIRTTSNTFPVTSHPHCLGSRSGDA